MSLKFTILLEINCDANIITICFENVHSRTCTYEYISIKPKKYMNIFSIEMKKAYKQ